MMKYKRILVVEDREEYRKNWKWFFRKYKKFLRVKAEIPSKLEEDKIGRNLFQWLEKGGYILLDNNLAEWGIKRKGEKLKCALETLGFEGKIILASEDNFEGKINVGKIYSYGVNRIEHIIVIIISLLRGKIIRDGNYEELSNRFEIREEVRKKIVH